MERVSVHEDQYAAVDVRSALQIWNCHQTIKVSACSLDSACKDASTKSQCPSGVRKMVAPWTSVGRVVPHLHTTNVESKALRVDPLAVRWLDSPLVPELRFRLTDVDACVGTQLTLQSGMYFSDPLRLHSYVNIVQKREQLFRWKQSVLNSHKRGMLPECGVPCTISCTWPSSSSQR